MKKVKKLISLLLCLGMCVCGSACRIKNGKTDGENDGEQKEEPIVYHTVTFDYNDGSGRVNKIQIPSGATITAYAPYVIEGVNEIVSWSSVIGGANYSAPIVGDVTLYATWRDFSSEIVEYTSEVPNVISERFVEIEPTSTSVLQGKTLSIGAGVKSIKFISNGEIFENLTILINSRVQDISVTFQDFGYTSDYSCAFDASNVTGTVNMSIIGSSGIKCVNQSLERERAADCIVAKKLSISGDGLDRSAFDLKAADGKNGESKGTAGNGCDGEDGGYGQDGGHGIVADMVSINGIALRIIPGNGGNGGDGGAGYNTHGLTSSGKYKRGGDGGYGGDGGCAIVAESFYSLGINCQLYGGNGGNGGNGGKGGGTSSTFGGAGGDGGHGGHGGNVFKNHVEVNEIVDSIYEFIVGKGGYGGSGGWSAHNSKGGEGGYEGVSGKTNYN